MKFFFENFIYWRVGRITTPPPPLLDFAGGGTPCIIVNFIAMAKKNNQSNAAAQRRSSTAAAPEESAAVNNPRLDWDYENSLDFSEMAEAIDADLKSIKVGFNHNEEGEEFPVFKVKTNKKAVANKLPDEARGFVTFAPSLTLQKRMEKEGEEWNKDYVLANARSFGFIPHPKKGYAGIGKLCILGGDYEIVDLSDLLEDEDDE